MCVCVCVYPLAASKWYFESHPMLVQSNASPMVVACDHVPMSYSGMTNPTRSASPVDEHTPIEKG